MKKLLSIIILGLLWIIPVSADDNCKDLNPEIILDLGGSSDPEKIVYSTYDSCTKKHDYCGSMGCALDVFDDKGELLKDINYAISLVDPNRQQIYLNPSLEEMTRQPYLGVKAAEGIDTQTVYIASEGMYTMYLALTGTGITNWENSVFSDTTFEIGKSGESTAPIPELYKPETSIPGWIKNNAGWWADGQIDDGSFVTAIQWLISNDVMTIPPTEQGTGSDDVIPSWIKNNAGWWADGQIDDNSFVTGLQWLISNGIMKIS